MYHQSSVVRTIFFSASTVIQYYVVVIIRRVLVLVELLARVTPLDPVCGARFNDVQYHTVCQDHRRMYSTSTVMQFEFITHFMPPISKNKRVKVSHFIEP